VPGGHEKKEETDNPILAKGRRKQEERRKTQGYASRGKPPAVLMIRGESFIVNG